MKQNWLHVVLLSCLLVTTLSAQSTLSKRWVYVSSNLYVNENIQMLEQLLKRAQKAGYNGVLFTDYKTFTWWQLEDAQRWRKNAQKLRSITKELQMELVACVFPFGTPDGVYRQVRQRIEIFEPDGGYVFNAIHNIQSNVSAENILAIFRAISDSY